jgi:Zn-dependent protease with chaperone function
MGKRRLLFTVVVVFITAHEVFHAIKRDPRDRVLLFQILAFVTFFLGMTIVKMAGISPLAIALWLALFFGLIILAAYIALIKWLNRRKKVT